MLQDYRFAGVPSLRVNVPFLFTGTNEDIERIEVLLGPASALYGPNTRQRRAARHHEVAVHIAGHDHQRRRRRALRRSARGCGTRARMSDRFGYKLSGEVHAGQRLGIQRPSRTATYSGTARAAESPRPGERARLRPRAFTRRGAHGHPSATETSEAITTVGYTNVGSGIELTGANGTAQIQNWTYTNLQQRFRCNRLFAQAFMNMQQRRQRRRRQSRRARTCCAPASRSSTSRASLRLSCSTVSICPACKQTFTYGARLHLAPIPRPAARSTAGTKTTTTSRSTARTCSPRRVRPPSSTCSPRCACDAQQRHRGRFPLASRRAHLQADRNAELPRHLQPRVLHAGQLLVLPRPDPGAEHRRLGLSTCARLATRRRRAGSSVVDAPVASVTSACGRRCRVLATMVERVRRGPSDRSFRLVGRPSSRRSRRPSSERSSSWQASPLRRRRHSARHLAKASSAISEPETRPTRSLLRAWRISSDRAAASTPRTSETSRRWRRRSTTPTRSATRANSGRRATIDIACWGQQRGDVGTPAATGDAKRVLRRHRAASRVHELRDGAVHPGLPALAGLPRSKRGPACRWPCGRSRLRALTPQFAPAPLGVVTFDGDNIARQRRVRDVLRPSTEKIWVRGTRCRDGHRRDGRVAFEGALQLQNQNVFDEIPGGNGAPLMSNSPRSRGSLGMRYRNDAMATTRFEHARALHRVVSRELRRVCDQRCVRDRRRADRCGRQRTDRLQPLQPGPGWHVLLRGRSGGLHPRPAILQAVRYRCAAAHAGRSTHRTSSTTASAPSLACRRSGRLIMTRLQYTF